MRRGAWLQWGRRLVAAAAIVSVFGVQTAMAADGCVRADSEGNISKEDRERGQRRAPELIAKAGVRCEIVNAAFIGSAKVTSHEKGKTVLAEILEVACKDDLGIIIPVDRSLPPEALDCLHARMSGKFSCVLKENFMAGGALDKLLAAAGAPDCKPARAAYSGELPGQKRRRYEVVCAVGGAVLLEVSNPRDERPPSALDCLHDSVFGHCKLSTREQLVADLAVHVASGVADKCRISDARLIGRLPARKASLFELGCGADQPGVLIELNDAEADEARAFRVIPCAEAASRFRISCTLKGTDQVGMQLASARDPRAPAPASVADTVWLKKPDGRDMSRLYPRRALNSLVTGRTHLRCVALSDGQLGDCMVSEEAPMGYGFGEATMNIASEFKMRMDLIDVSPLAGTLVTIPIRFCLPG